MKHCLLLHTYTANSKPTRRRRLYNRDPNVTIPERTVRRWNAKISYVYFMDMCVCVLTLLCIETQHSSETSNFSNHESAGTHKQFHRCSSIFKCYFTHVYRYHG